MSAVLLSSLALLSSCYILFFLSVETARIQKESAAINAKVEEHGRASSELRRLQVNETNPVIHLHRALSTICNPTK